MKNHLSQFIKEKVSAVVQEMNLSYFNLGQGDAVHKMLEELEDAGKDYKMISRKYLKIAGISLILILRSRRSAVSTR